MENSFFEVKMLSGAAAGFISYFLGGWDGWLATLCTCMGLDFISGIIAALLNKSKKTAGGGLESRQMFHGGLRKILVLVVVAMAVVLDQTLLPGQSAIRDAVCVYFIVEEGLSVLENVGTCGVKLPAVLVRTLEQLKSESEKLEKVEKDGDK